MATLVCLCGASLALSGAVGQAFSVRVEMMLLISLKSPVRATLSGARGRNIVMECRGRGAVMYGTILLSWLLYHHSCSFLKTASVFIFYPVPHLTLTLSLSLRNTQIQDCTHALLLSRWPWERWGWAVGAGELVMGCRVGEMLKDCRWMGD